MRLTLFNKVQIYTFQLFRAFLFTRKKLKNFYVPETLHLRKKYRKTINLGETKSSFFFFLLHGSIWQKIPQSVIKPRARKWALGAEQETKNPWVCNQPRLSLSPISSSLRLLLLLLLCLRTDSLLDASQRELLAPERFAEKRSLLQRRQRIEGKERRGRKSGSCFGWLSCFH